MFGKPIFSMGTAPQGKSVKNLEKHRLSLNFILGFIDQKEEQMLSRFIMHLFLNDRSSNMLLRKFCVILFRN